MGSGAQADGDAERAREIVGAVQEEFTGSSILDYLAQGRIQGVSIRTLSQPNHSGVYRGPQLCRVSGISYRQLDWWDRTGLLQPSVALAQGSGSQRLYSREDLVLALAIRRLLSLGASLQSIRELTEPGLPGDRMGLREAIRRRRKRWTATVAIGEGSAGIWIDLAPLWKLAQEGDPDTELGPRPAA